MKLFRTYTVTLPSPLGLGILFILLCGAFLFLFFSLETYLSPTKKVDANILVVEGMTPDFALQGAIDEFNLGGYDYLACTGIPLYKGAPLVHYKNTAIITSELLQLKGFEEQYLLVATTCEIRKDRTYASAVVLLDSLRAKNISLKGVNVYSLGVHSRRSYDLYKQVFGEMCDVGIIAAPDIRYDTQRWWSSSNGVRAVIKESIAWVYAHLFFQKE